MDKAENSYAAQPGEEIKRLPFGAVLVTHPDRKARVVHPDGREQTWEDFKREAVDRYDQP